MIRLLADIRLAIRSLHRSPTFTVVAVLTLALGIGANTAIFSVVNGVLLKPLAYPDSDQLLSLNFTAPGIGYPLIPFSDDFYLFVRDQHKTLDAVAMYNEDNVNLVGEGDPVRVAGANVTPSMFDVLRVPALLGRALTGPDGEVGAEPVAVIAHELWQGRFGGDPDILDRTEDMDGVMRRIVGVMPADFAFPDAETRIWKPYIIDEANVTTGNFSNPGLARLASGMTTKDVIDDTASLLTRLFEERSSDYPPALIERAEFAPRIESLKEVIVGDVRQALLVILGTVGLVLLIACANVANLFLVRAETRQREVTLRAALGAGRGDLARFFLAESMILALSGGAVGVVLAAIGVRTFTTMAPVAIPRISEIGIDTRVLGFTLLASLLTGLLFGMIPVLRRQASDLAGSLREGGRSVTTGQGALSVRNVLVVAQVALALVLLVGSGLMIRSFQSLRTVDPGFDADGLLVVQVALPGPDYPDAEQRLAFWSQVRARAAALPGVTAAGVLNHVPMGWGRSAGSFDIEDFPQHAESGQLNLAEKKRVGAGGLEVLGVPLIEGRYLNDDDGAGRFRGVVVSKSLAQHWWPQQSPLGKRVRETEDEEWYEIVGVVGDVHYISLEEPAEEVLYMPLMAGAEGSPNVSANMAVLLRTEGPPSALVGPMRSVVRGVDPRMPIARSETLATLLSNSMARTSFTLVMLGIASSAALLLGAIGIYGVVSYVVGQRTQEIGVRIALGASRGSVQGMVVRRGLLVCAVGIVVGVLAALAAGSVLGSLLYKVNPFDPLTYVTVVAALGGTALVASWLPALRASGVDPVVALRSD